MHKLCFSFLLGITAVPREIENNACAQFCWANKVHCGRCPSSVWLYNWRQLYWYGLFFFQIWSKSLSYHASCCLFFLLITVQLTSIVLMSTNVFQIWSSLAELAVGFTNGLIFWMNSEFFQLLCFYIPWQRAKWDGYIRRPLVITLPNSTLFRVPAFQPFLVEISSCWLNIALHLIFAFFAWIWKPETGQCKLNPEMIYLIDSSFNTASSRKQGRIQKIQKGAAGTLASYSENS